jgi:thiol-disulfide isomerase/thioredoxin
MYRKWFVYLAPFVLLISLQASAVDYELPDTSGQPQSFTQYRGKWVVVNYWATWCTTCVKELPELASFHQNNKDKDAVVVGVNFEDISMEELSAFIEDAAIPYPVLSSKPVPVTPLGKVPALPTTYVVSPEGNVVAGDVGIITQQDLEDYIAGEKAARNIAEKAAIKNDVS